MRRSDLDRLAPALTKPLRGFVRQARVRIALLLSGSGQVLAQHGFAPDVSLMNVASLAAAANASAGALVELASAGRRRHMHHEGRRRQLFLAPIQTPAGEFVLVAIFDDDSSLGLVQLFFERMAAEVAALPALAEAAPSADAGQFEHDLEAGLDRLFSPGA